MGAPAPVTEEIRSFTGAVGTLRALTAADLDSVNTEILTRLHSPVKMIPELAGHLINAGGKRLRPMLTLAAARAFGYAGKDHVSLAAAVELIHGATLLHDDVVDESALRRGLTTANVIWGNKESVLVGDFILSRAFELMVDTGNLRVLQILSGASGVIAEGEVLQLATQKNLDATFEMYLAVVDAKTAALFAAAARVGAVIAGASTQEEEALHLFGRNLGVAFQLVDDALDYSGGAAASLGKNIGDDFREGKMTAPVVYAYRDADEPARAFWRRTIAEGRQDKDDLAHARRLMEHTGAIEETLACARAYADEAIAALKIAPDTPYTRALAEVVDLSVSRAY